MAHFGGKCIDAGCIDGLRIPVKMVVNFHQGLARGRAISIQPSSGKQISARRALTVLTNEGLLLKNRYTMVGGTSNTSQSILTSPDVPSH
jgi:hypothetical protein